MTTEVTINTTTVDVTLVVASGPTITLQSSGTAEVVISPVGMQGPPGPVGGRYTHIQGSAATVWTINHNLGFTPAVAVYSVGGVEVEAEIVAVSPNQIQVLFAVATAGTASLT